MHSIIVPIFICVVLPVAIVWIIFHASINNDNKRAQVLIKAIETNNGIDCDKLAEAMTKPHKTPRELSNLRLLRGCIFSLVGVAVIGVSFLFAEWGIRGDQVTMPLILGMISLAVGISYLVVYFVSRKQIKD